MTNKRLLATALLLAMLLATVLVPTVAFADINIGNGASYDTDVLVDLQRDSKFNIADYPVNENDYSLQVIALAQDSIKELYVYVYSPAESKQLTATSINIFTSTIPTLSYMNYDLVLVSRNGVFSKYAVPRFGANANATIEVPSIFRAWNEDLDEDTGNDNTISEVSFPVGKAWTFVDGVQTSVKDVDVIQVTDKYVGFVRYLGDNVWGETYYLDSHFIAFSTDKQIDKLMEADVFCKKQHIIWKKNDSGLGDDIVTRDDIEDQYCYLDYTQHGSYTGSGWFYDNSYEWPVITTATNFLETEDRTSLYKGLFVNVSNMSQIDTETYNLIADKQWVIRFLDTPFNREIGGLYDTYDYYSVTDVTILRLKFETDGVVYNLGVVDNKQTGSGNPVNDLTTKAEATDLLQIVLGLVMLILIAVVGMPVLKAIFTVVFLLLKIVWKGIVLIISLPINLIKLLFGGGK